MKYFYLITNMTKQHTAECAADVMAYLTERGCVCVRRSSDMFGLGGQFTGADGRKSPAPGKNGRLTDPSEIPPETECAIVLGGDGTMLRASHDLAGTDIPLFGINMGHLGYLTQVSRQEDIHPALERLIGDKFRVDRRMMLRGRIICDGKVWTEDIALNDVILNRDGMDALHFDVYVNGKLSNHYNADGLIVCTPTGSTAYNLSAGGPIVEPRGNMIIVTPICPHSLTARSIILSPDSRVSVRLSTEFRRRQCVSFDGRGAIRMNPTDIIDVERCELSAPLIELDQVPFLEKIRRKMGQL